MFYGVLSMAAQMHWNGARIHENSFHRHLMTSDKPRAVIKLLQERVIIYMYFELYGKFSGTVTIEVSHELGIILRAGQRS